MGEITHFVLGEEAPPFAVLANHLHSPSPNVIRAYISAYSEDRDTILDPFAQTDVVAREALKLGKKAILSDFNPITTFVARTLHSTLTEQQMAYALVRLGEGTKLQTSLRQHLNDLYASTCSRCQRPVTISYFVWSREGKRPVTKAHYCTCCQPRDGTRRVVSEAANEQDIEVANRVEPRGFHYWYVLDRLAPPPGSLLTLCKQALDTYTPRNLYGLVTVLMQIESGFENPQQQDFLKLALLDCFDRCAKANANAGRRNAAESSRLRVPAQFLERNVWEEFEETCRSVGRQIVERRQEGYASRAAAHPEQLIWQGPAQPPSQMPNICIAQQMARFLTNELPESSVDFVITDPPRPERMEYLTLSYLWAGWLFGSEQTQIFEHVRATHPKADWPTYFKASVSSLRALGHVVREDGTIVLVFSSDDLSQCIALMVAGVGAGLRLRRVLHCPHAEATATGGRSKKNEDDYVLEFYRPSPSAAARRTAAVSAKGSSQTPGPEPPKIHNRQDLEQAFSASIGHSAKKLLSDRGEPTGYRWLALAVYEHLATEGLLSSALGLFREEEDMFGAVGRFTHEMMQTSFRSHLVPVRTEAAPATESVWWLPRRPLGVAPLSERVEGAIYSVLSTTSGTTQETIQQAVLGTCPGLLTPDLGWVEDCIASYASSGDTLNLNLRAEDSLKKRTLEHNQMIAILARLGHEFGFKVWIGRVQQNAGFNGKPLGSLLSDAERSFGPESLLGGPNAAQTDVVWYEYGRHIYTFDVEWTTAFAEAVMSRNETTQSVRRFLVVPEERVLLIRSKLARFPWLSKAVDETPWEFIKFRHLKAFETMETDRNVFSLNKIVGLSPPVEQETAQLRLL